MQRKRKHSPVEPASLAASLASSATDPYTVILLALAHCAAGAGITLETNFIPLEDKLTAIARSLEQHPGPGDFITGARLLISKIRTESKRSEHGAWKN